MERVLLHSRLVLMLLISCCAQGFVVKFSVFRSRRWSHVNEKLPCFLSMKIARLELC
jgi:hypothetical protein